MSSLLAPNNKTTLRAPVNPLDVSTIVSIFPKTIDETKHTIQPGRFLIPKGSYEKPTLVVLGPSSWWKDVGETQPLLEIALGSIVIADSVIKDYCNGLLSCNMSDAMPGLFYLPGSIDLKKLKTDFSAKLDEAKAKQRKWFSNLIQLADALWARSSGNPLAISDDMRLAAQELGLEDKPWIKDFKSMEMVRCFACGNLRNPEYPICPTCKSVDLKHPLAGSLKFAQG